MDARPTSGSTTAIPLYGTRPTVYGDAHCLPLRNASVDAVACYEVLEHVVDPVHALRELARVLVPGGVAECSMPFLYPIHDAPHDFQRWTRHAWMRHAEEAGFEVVAIESMQKPFEVAGLMWAMAIAGPLERRRGPAIALGVLAGLPLVLVANLAAAVAARVWPAWDAMCTGYRVRLVKVDS
jgi:SAM-dependent methyltransferase